MATLVVTALQEHQVISSDIGSPLPIQDSEHKGKPEEVEKLEEEKGSKNLVFHPPDKVGALRPDPTPGSFADVLRNIRWSMTE